MTYIDRPTDYLIAARRSRRGTDLVRATCHALALRASSVHGEATWLATITPPRAARPRQQEPVP